MPVAPNLVIFVVLAGLRWQQPMPGNDWLLAAFAVAIGLQYWGLREASGAGAPRLRAVDGTYRLLFEHAGEAIFEANLQGELIRVNPALAAIYGFNSPERFLEGLPPGSAPGQHQALLEALREEEKVVNFEFETQRADGHPLRLSQSVRIVRDASGRRLYLQGTVEDAAFLERTRAQEALRLSELRKAAILDLARDAIVSVEDGGGILEFNGAAERLFGHRRSEVLGRDLLEALVPGAVQETERRGQGFLEGCAGQVGPVRELMAIRKDGSELSVEMSSSRVMIGGKAMGTVYLRDLEERREAARITSELAAVVANSSDAVVACTLEGVIRSWNFAAQRLYGYAASEALGRSLQMLFPPEHLEEFPRTLAAMREGISRSDHELGLLRKDGQRVCVSLSDSPVRDALGVITGFSSIARDVTERKRLEEELLQSQKMDAVGRLAGGIAHDFNNILTAILGYSDLIIGQIDERQWMYRYLFEIRKSADFAASLTHQLLAFSRRQPLYLKVFDVNESVRNLQAMLGRVIGEHIRIETQFEMGVGCLKADPSQLEQVLLNLCINARDAMPRGGAIRIATANFSGLLPEICHGGEAPAGEYVCLTVSDTGNGIEPEVLKHIFEPFFTTKDVGQGTGLGLATCYGIVKQSGGYISVESEVGKGSVFSVYLPRVSPGGEKIVPVALPGGLAGGNETILYVEDEKGVRILTTHVLRHLGYTVLEAEDSRHALELMDRHDSSRLDLVFSDVVLPDMGAGELARLVRARSTETRLLFTSGYVDESILREHGIEKDAPFLQKPFTPAELARKVREVLDGAIR